MTSCEKSLKDRLDNAFQNWHEVCKAYEIGCASESELAESYDRKENAKKEYFSYRQSLISG